MSVFDSRQKTSASLLGAVLVGGMLLGGSAFAVEPLGQGLQVAAASAGEGKCGEGKCGDASFARTDTDHDGKVSRAEFLAVAKDRAGEFDSIDSDHDGFISEAEAYEHLRKTYEANGKPMPAGLFSKLEQGRH
ncbi:EF-hand domain-containing protein [Pseudomonas aeruginosa]|uniref:HvfA family oxazolone/thioamide-modified RiPP metallophore n=1 Tax=Pseudomonas aeruginosa TaxID=287 RepID=UPI0022911213|nr:EF-hand domain-containing protein [Pseudomonas aeruginosa]HCT4815129.1 EF-hand domain-containing protein [Pseudomonas aeruginosa]HCT4815799.1 EF-hand domain-containing protein [Pseudomonas aeruginosa]HEJ5156989.1 EF-hand domain-containing protein [Pseudomonas aeruginosa]HEJ5158125.1 EF-hand domain-containing protein [Pseudomonas aeruginosa]